ncbi:MAG TPA: hypothetical protein VE398_03855 [Acidobacteriota bacterium]|nr:hypothetical protein [Acidobacteriota bacterium]
MPGSPPQELSSLLRAWSSGDESALDKLMPLALGELRSDVPVRLQHIVKKMLAKYPQDRYVSIHEVRNDLKDLSEEPLMFY